MSKITNDGLTPSGTGCFISVQCTHMATVGVKGLNESYTKVSEGTTRSRRMPIIFTVSTITSAHVL